MKNPLKARTYDSIVAPLSKMVEDLTIYTKEQSKKISNLTRDKLRIENQISVSQDEIKKSEETVKNIKGLIGGK